MYRLQETDTKHVLYKDREVRWKARPFQPNEEIFAESCSVRYKDLFRTKKIGGVIGTFIVYSRIVRYLVNCSVGVCFFSRNLEKVSYRSPPSPW